jgi:hypothetical protein
VGFEVLTAVVMKSTIFWDITQNICLPPAFTLISCSAIFDPEDGGDMFLRNVGSYSTDYKALYPRR